MGLLVFLLISVLVIYGVVAIFVFVDIYVDYLPPPGDRKIIEGLLQNMPDGVTHYYCGELRVRVGRMSSIKRLWPMFLAPYYIINVGIVPTWYKSRKMIDKIYKEEKRKFKIESKIRRKNEINKYLKLN